MRTKGAKQIFVIIQKMQYTLIKPDEKTDFHALYDKIQPFKIWKPNCLSCGGMVGIWLKRKEKEPLRMTVDEYNAAIDEGKNFLSPEHVEYFLVDKPAYEDMTKCGYLYEAEEKEKKVENVDETDKEFIQTKGANLKKLEFYGLHSYGGYWGFFRPDLLEVLTLISESLPPLRCIEKIYVTTEAHPNDNVRECYDSKADRHRAKTTVYIVFKQKTKIQTTADELEKVGQVMALILRGEEPKANVKIECVDSDMEDKIVEGFVKQFRKENSTKRKAFQMHHDSITTPEGSKMVFSRSSEPSFSIQYL